MSEAARKFLQVALIVLVCLGADQWTKHLASSRLASSRAGHFSHYVVLTVPENLDGVTVREFLEHEFGATNTPAEIGDILSGVTDDGAVRLAPGRTLRAGDVVEVRHREIVVVPDHFDLQYTRNEGAAFSFLADADETWRGPFFLITGALALAVIAWLLRGVAFRQQLLIWSLALILGGAVGNLADRVRLGYVVDFIVWKWTDDYRWPTFNLADAFIVIGIALLIVEMIRDTLHERREREPEQTPG